MNQQEWKHLKEILWTALEKEAEDRERFLSQVCGEDAKLRLEVESLIAVSENSEFLLEKETADFAPKMVEDQYEGNFFGQYKIVREIGRGGMGKVFLAERADGEFFHKVAIKIVRRSLDNGETEKYFRRERQILANLNHPNIAHLFDGGISLHGEPFIVMEFVEGKPLLEYVEAHRLSIEERLDLFLKICSAVDYAHRKSVIHRDIKPSNIFVTQDGEPKLLDFGLADFAENDFASDDLRQTKNVWRAFTLKYASPEQIRGDKLTAFSDIYSLSVVLYELLTGNCPFDFERKSINEVLQTLETQMPSKPSQVLAVRERKNSTSRNYETARREKALRSSEIKGNLDNICLKGLQAVPEQRYESARGLADDIKLHLRGLPVSARANSFSYRAEKFFSENKKELIFSVFIFLTLLSLWLLWRETSSVRQSGAASTNAPKTIAVMPLKSMENSAADSELRVGLADSIITKLGSVSQIAVRPTSATVKYLDQSYDFKDVGAELKVDFIIEGSLQKGQGKILVNLQMVSITDGKIVWADSFVNDPENILSGQESIANRVSRIMLVSAPLEIERHPPSYNLLAQDAYLKGTYALNSSARTVETLFRARDFFQQSINLDGNFAQAYCGLAMTYTLAGSMTFLSPEESYPLAERAARRALALEPNSAPAYVVLGEVEADYNWNWAAAEQNFQRALEIAPNLASAHHGYSEFLARQGRFEESAAHSELAQKLDPTRINYVAVRALHYLYERDYEKVVEQSNLAISRSKNTYLAYLYISITETIRGNFAEAERAGLTAFEISGGGAGDLFVLGSTYAAMKDEKKTDEILTKLSLMSKTRYVDPIHYVCIYGFAGNKEKAFEYLEKSHREKSYWMTALKVNPAFDSLKDDPRFTRMLKKMNL